LRRLDTIRLDGEKRFDGIDDHRDRRAHVEHDGACAHRKRCVRHAKQAAEACHRQHGAAQIRDAQQGARTLRNTGHRWDVHDLADVRRMQRVSALAHPHGQ
jgi:hypothetical protein